MIKIEIKNNSITIPDEWHHLLMDIEIAKLEEPDSKINKKNRKNKRIFRIIKPNKYYILNLKQNFYFLPKVLHYNLKKKQKRKVFNLPFKVINIDDFNEENTNLLIGGGYHLNHPGFALIFYLVDEKNFSIKIRYWSNDSFYVETDINELTEIIGELEKLHNLNEIPTFKLEQSIKKTMKKYLGKLIKTFKDKKDIIILPTDENMKELGVKRLYLPIFISILKLALELKREEGILTEDPFFKEPIIYKILNCFLDHEKLSEPFQVATKEIVSKRNFLKRKPKKIL